MQAVVKWMRLSALVCGVWGATALTAAALDLRIVGVNQDSNLYAALRGGSLLVEQSGQEVQPSRQEIVAAAQADYGRLIAILYDNGYFGPVIQISLDGREAAEIPPVSPPQRIDAAVISIDAGRKFTFVAPTIGPLAPDTSLPVGFAAGETARLGVLKDAVSAGIDGWRKKGHAKAALAGQDLVARHHDRTIRADLRLAPGPQLRFGSLNVEGNQAVRTARIVEIAGLPTGEVFLPEQLRLAQQRLRRTGSFNAVALQEADGIGPNNTLPITARIVESKPRRFGFGGELSSLEGLTVSTFWLHRNFLGGAERLRLEAEIKGIGGNSGGEDYKIAARFDRPATFNADTDFYALAELQQLDEVNYFSRQLDLEAGIKRLANANRTYTFGLGLRRAETEDAFGVNKYTLFTVPISAEFDYRNVPFDPTDGYYLKAAITPFFALSGADNGVRSYVDARAYRTFGTARPVTLAFRGQLGSVVGPDLSAAPADYLFYSGGSGSVRGQPYQILGADLPNGNTAGGRSFVGISAEARFKITDSIGLVGFADAGYIGEEEFYDGSGVWHSGAGFGLRYATGIGPIRVDVAVPTSGPDTGEDFQVYIGIGQAF